jgi:two-component system, OmpR family, phosphate regulon response regulator PhoB
MPRRAGGRRPRVAAAPGAGDTVAHADHGRVPAAPGGPGLVSDAHVLVVDDERDITALVAYHLARAGYRVTTAGTGVAALEAVAAEPPDLIVLDLMLPGRSGYEVLDELRRHDATRDVGVIVLTARRDESDRIKGLAGGADDYLTKPFSPEELVLRVQAVLRRLRAPAAAAGPVLRAGPLAVDRAAHTVTVDGEAVELTPLEYRLLLLLLERRGRVQSRPDLLETVWDSQPDIQTRTVDMHVQRLRAKLGDAGAQIETVRGFGYRFRAAGRDARDR